MSCFGGNPFRLGRILAWPGLAPALVCALCGCSSRLDLGSNDAGTSYDADCRPGTYAGTYACDVSDGSSLFAFAPNGPIAVTLVPMGAGALALSPEAPLSTATSGPMSTATLTGTLECSTRQLKGTVQQITLSSGTLDTTIRGQGEFSATYDPDASPPALIEGVMNPPQLASTCTWTAQLK